jgi:hypothetical protein
MVQKVKISEVNAWLIVKKNKAKEKEGINYEKEIMNEKEESIRNNFKIS